MKNKINAEIIADSINEHGNRITTFVLTYPRIIHAELLTHRLFSRNAASSRAIPASKMIKDVEEDPFIPVAFQKAHSGMQGTEYFENETRTISDTVYKVVDLNKIHWLRGKDNAVSRAKELIKEGVTKQLINRILEPYQWYTCIVTATEYDNFFELRCPQYGFTPTTFKSRKDAIEHFPDCKGDSLLDWLKRNEGQGEIHISLLAEAMWDAMNESTPKQLKAGEWHIPFNNNLGEGYGNKRIVEAVQSIRGDKTAVDDFAYNEAKIKIATARCARVSYLNFEGKDDYEADIKLYDRLKDMGHYSPFEHCARAMSEDEFYSHIMGVDDTPQMEHYNFEPKCNGWSGNFRGFVQLRKEIE